MANPFVWYELLTVDPEAAKAFYPEVTGWKTGTFEIPGAPPYLMWQNGDRPIGGALQMPPEAVAQGAHPHWLPYAGVPSVDETYQRALELGAKSFVAPQDIPNVGRFAVLADPQGAMFALHSSSTTPLAEPKPPVVGDVSWHELSTSDPEAAWTFYGTLFGWHETGRMDMGADGTYQMFGWADFPVGGIFPKPPHMPAPSWVLYVNVPDLEASVATAKSLGGQILYGPMEVPDGSHVAGALDPQAAMFALHQFKR